jgi:uncharacterized protein YfaS (alpha-2-macroglobulin family)
MLRRFGLFLLLTLLVMIVPGGYAQDGLPAQPGSAPEADSTALFRVTEVLPSPNTAEIETNVQVTVIFNRPVVPLSVAPTPNDGPQPLSFSPDVAGTGRWLNTSIYVFRPDAGFAGGTTYTATVEGIESFDGIVVEPYTWRFTTIAPRVTQVIPEPMASGVPLEDAITVEFNQAMDRVATETSFSLVEDTNGETVPGALTWDDDSTTLSFQPSERLKLDTFYRARVDGTVARAAGNGALLGADAPNWTFLTVPLPAIVSTSPLDGGQAVGTYEGVVLNFASEMNQDTLAGRIRIEPEPEVGVYRFYSTYNQSYRVNFEAQPSTTYTVTIEPGMEDIYGNAIQNGFTFTYTTRELDPEVSLQTPGEVGLYDADRETTEVYLAYRNVDAVDLLLYDVPTADLVTNLTDEEYDVAYGYTPPPGTLLREWSVDGTAIPQNIRRYDLINLGGDPAQSACQGAPPSRLSVGDLGVVVTDPDPLRARSEPPGGEIVELMYRDYRFNVLSGPRCIDSIPWWEVELRDERRAWIAESVDGEYLVDVRTVAEGGTVEVAATADGGPLEPGVYFLQALSPQVRNGEPTPHFMVVANANLTLKTGTNSVAVWATNIHTGQPVPNAEVQLYGTFGQRLGTIITGADGAGMTRVSPSLLGRPRRVVAVLEGDGQFGMGSADWTNGISPYQFDVRYDPYPVAYSSYLYTDRPIYRPDQPVYFRGIVRSKADVTYTAPDFEQADVTIYDPDGEVVYTEALQVDAYGAFSDVFDIAADAKLGSYRVAIADPTDPDLTMYNLRFDVAEYRVPEYQVNVTTDADEVVVGTPINATVDADYFFGGGVGDAAAEFVVESTPYAFRYQGEGRYSFREYDPYSYRYLYPYGRTVADQDARTEANGEVTVEFMTDEVTDGPDEAATLTIEATVRDESDISVSGRTSVLVHPTELYVGVGLSRYINRAGDTMEINLTAVGWDSEPVARQQVDVIVERWQWVTVQEVDANGTTVFTDELQIDVVDEGRVRLNGDGVATYSFTPEQGGVYKIIAVTEDDGGREARASQVAWVSGNEYVQWRVDNDNTLEVVADADEYSVGDTAQILVTSPFQGTTEALVTVERDGVIMAEHVTLESNSLVYDLPITDEYAPNIFVSVMLVKGVDETNPIAAFRYGVVQLNVDTSRKIINIEITPDVDQAAPQETVTYTVRTTNYLGEPVSAQVGVGLTDLASLSLAPPNSGPILQAFYGIQALAVSTSSPLSINTDEVTAYVRDVIKGGGGGGGGLNGIFEIRGEFVDTAYWNATLETDANGEAQFAVRLPDNLTTWRLDARALTLGTEGPMLVGQDTFDLISNLPLLARPVTPRFFVVGDEVVVSSVVNNNTGAEQDVTAFIEADGVSLVSDNEQTQSIPDGGRALFEWRVLAEDVSDVDMTFFATTEDGAFTDASKPPAGLGDARLIPVYRYEVPLVAGTAGVLRGEESVDEGVLLPPNPDTSGELTVSVDTSLASVTVDGLNYLRNYPHQCTEQTISRFMPNIVTAQALSSLGIDDPMLAGALDEQVNTGLQILYTRQNTDGGWGWFSRDRSNALVTAYVLIGLVEAQDAGYPVSDGVIAGGRTYLTGNMPLDGVAGIGGADWQFNREAFALYALARASAPDASRASNLYENRMRLNTEGRAFLALALDLANTDDPRVATLTSDILSNAAQSATGTFWSSEDIYNWTTNTRTTAVVLELLVKTQPDSELIPNVVRYLISARTADAWETTQETAWTVMALTDWMVASDDLNAAYDFSVAVNGEALLDDVADGPTDEDIRLQVDVAELLQDEINTLTVGRGAGAGNLYYTAFLEATLPVEDVEPASNGITVARQYAIQGADGQQNVSVESAVVGDIVQVTLTIIAPEDLHYVIVEDPIPAGMEPIDPGLLTSTSIGTRPGVANAEKRLGLVVVQ